LMNNVSNLLAKDPVSAMGDLKAIKE
jgi:hypothetical protein